MANARVILKRRGTIRNIRKITRTMEMVATARFKKIHDQTLAARAYTRRMGQLAADLSRVVGESIDNPMLAHHPDAPQDALIVLTSNRGMCGGYNSSIMRRAMEELHHQAGQQRVDVYAVGKKAVGYLNFHRVPLASSRLQFEGQPRFQEVTEIADSLMGRFTAGQLRMVQVCYMQFLSAGVQRPALLTLLPMDGLGLGGEMEITREEAQHAGPTPQYEFLPDPASLVDDLLPHSVRARLFQCFLDAMVSEQVSRMTAMRLATENAETMIRELTMQYNRARQSSITTELAEIMSGAEALK